MRTRIYNKMRMFSPVPDNIHLAVHEPSYSYEALAAEIPCIIGSTEDEMAGFGFPGAPAVFTDEVLRELLLKQLNTPMMPLPGALPEHKEYTPEDVAHFISVFKEKTGQTDPEQLFWNIVTLSGGLGNGAYLQATERASQGGAPFYAYLTAIDCPTAKDPGKKYSFHVCDLPLQLHIVFHPEYEEVSRKYSNAWAQFIRTGNPSTEELEWPAYVKGAEKIMVFDWNTRVEDDFRGTLNSLFH